jgi:hypothetical protein
LLSSLRSPVQTRSSSAHIRANLGRPSPYCSPPSLEVSYDSATPKLRFDGSDRRFSWRRTNGLLQTSTTPHRTYSTVCLQGMPPSPRAASIAPFICKVAMCSFKRIIYLV